MSSDLDSITEKLLASYEAVGGINHLNDANLPSKPAIGELCSGLMQLAFPGFFHDQALDERCMRKLTRAIVGRVAEGLRDEIARSLRFRKNSPPKDALECIAHGVVCQFLAALPEIRRVLSTDVIAAYEGDPAARSLEEIILSYPCIEAIAIQRMAHELYELDVPIIPRMMTEWAHERSGIDIHPGAKIGEYFFIDHGTGVVIGETTVIGKRVKLYHGVTLGARSFERDEEGNLVKGNKRHPNVEDHVTIYANATILGGNTTIGEGSTIGANVFVMDSVDAGSAVGLKESNLKIAKKRAPAAHG
jgi:serine O-acetyltransferase